MSRQLILILFACCALMGLHPAAAEIVSDQVEGIDQVLILNAATASLKPGNAAGVWEIILKPQVGNLVTSNPTVAFRTVYGKAVPDNWTDWFENKPTPAVLTWQDKTGEHGLVLAVDQPRANHGVLRFTARLSPQADGTLASFNQYAGNLPQRGTVKQAALYLDDTRARVIRSKNPDGQTINGCVIEALTSCPNADLSGADLSGADLTGANLFHANLFHANLTDANLTDGHLAELDLSDATLTGATLTNAILLRATLRGATLINANLTLANLLLANLSSANLTDANLTQAILLNANLRGATLTGAVFCKTLMPNGSTNNSGCP